MILADFSTWITYVGYKKEAKQAGIELCQNQSTLGMWFELGQNGQNQSDLSSW